VLRQRLALPIWLKASPALPINQLRRFGAPSKPMVTAAQEESRGATRGRGAAAQARIEQGDAMAVPVAPLASLLSATTLDLARISQEIRGRADLESLVLRLAASLALSAEGSVMSLEDAVVVLGTDRLRVLVYLWSTFVEETGARDSGESVQSESATACGSASVASGGTNWAPEALYLAGFLRWLGLDSPVTGASRQQRPCTAFGLPNANFAQLRDMLMRDFLALIPMMNLQLEKLHRKVTP